MTMDIWKNVRNKTICFVFDYNMQDLNKNVMRFYS